jgi:3-hydroxy-9,10-secoandrosta-1,3,5(10)-triene-9,17-dione monooxygenase reductase component
MAEFDDRAFRNAMGNFTTGVVIATGMDGEHPVGFAAQSFVSLSLDPPLVGLQKTFVSTFCVLRKKVSVMPWRNPVVTNFQT